MAVGSIFENAPSRAPAAEGRSSTRLLADAGEMTLRVRAPRHEAREVRIRSPKCTVGSAAGCTLRLRARGVSGLHCWILRGPQGSVIRRLHGTATLNGAQFDEAPVKIGDCLRIGPVEVEIVACNQPPAAPQPVFRPAAVPSEESAEMQLKLDEALVQIKRLQAESRQAFQSSIVAAERADQLRDALALANDQLEEMYKELAASEQAIEKATTELEECRRQLAASGAADKDDGKSAQNAREQATTALRQCELLTAELANAKAEINKDRESWNIERAELQRLIAQQAEELEAARSSAVAQTCALTTPLDQRTAEDAVREELEPKLMALEQQLAAKQREIDSLQQQLEHESAQGNAATIAFNERPKDDDGVRKEYEAKLAELEKQVSDKQHQLATLQQRLDEESAQGCAMTVTLDQRAKEDEGARKRLESKLSDMEQQLALREREIESLRDQLEDESAQGCAMTIALNDQTKDDNASRKELQAKLTELENQLAQKQQQLDGLQQRLDEEAAQGCAMTIALNERSQEDNTASKELQAKLTDLEGQLTAKQGEIEELQQRLESHGAVQHRLERLAAEYDAKCHELDDVRSQLTAAGEKNAAAQQELDQQTEALIRREEALSQHEAALAETQQRCVREQDQLQAERDRLAAIQDQTKNLTQQQSQFNDRAAELEAISAQAASKQAELAEIREQLERERAALEAQSREVHQQRQELELLRQKNDARAQELENQQRELHAQQQVLAEREATVASRARHNEATAVSHPSANGSGPAVAAPRHSGSADSSDAVGVDSVLSRLVKAGVWRNDEPGAEPDAGSPGTPRSAVEPAPETSALTARRTAESASQADSDEQAPHPSTDAIGPLSPPPSRGGSDEESIESYMERLMKRVRGDEGAPNAAGPLPAAAAPVSAPVVAESAASPPPMGEGQQPAAEPAEFSPRRTAPEQVANMSAMRDLANSAARSAIDRHVRKHTGQQAAGRLMGAFLTVGLSAGLGFWAWKSNSLQAAAGAIIGGGLGMHWLLSAARRLFKLRRLNAPQDAPNGQVNHEAK